MSNQLKQELVTFKDGKKVYIDGPLSKIFTQTLYDLYPKEVDEQTGIVLESQMTQVLQQISNFSDLNKNNKEFKEKAIGVLYSVDSVDCVLDDLLNITKNVNTLTNEQQINSAVIINNPDDNQLTDAALAVENYCNNSGIRVFSSLNKYMKSKRV